MSTVYESILTTLSLYPSVEMTTLIAIEEHHGFDRIDILNALENLILAREILVAGNSLSLAIEREEVIPEKYLQAADNYRKAHAKTWRNRIPLLDQILTRFGFAIALFIITTFFTLGLCANEWRSVLVEATAYCPNCQICDTTWTTANGTDCRDRVYGIAASNDILLGSTIIIPRGYGYMDVRFSDRQFVCDDRGGALNADRDNGSPTRIDLRYRTHASAVQFGRKLMYVFIK